MSETNISADFPFEPHFAGLLGSRLHYVDEGSGDPILFLHGNPTSSYLWRNIIPHLTSAGRCIAPDLIGMGKSGKPDIEYTFFDHSRYVEGFIEALGLENITFVIHDWGSAIGFHYARRHENNVKGLAFMEAILGPLQSWDDMHPGFRRMLRAFRTPDAGWDMIVNQNFFVEQALPGAVSRKLTEEEMNVYREPYLELEARKPLWRWPNEIPIEGKPADVHEAVEDYQRWLHRTQLPKLLLHASPGVLIREQAVEWAKANLPNLKTADIGTGIHFVQEDNPHQIGAELAAWLKTL